MWCSIWLLLICLSQCSHCRFLAFLASIAPLLAGLHQHSPRFRADEPSQLLAQVTGLATRGLEAGLRDHEVDGGGLGMDRIELGHRLLEVGLERLHVESGQVHRVESVVLERFPCPRHPCFHDVGDGFRVSPYLQLCVGVESQPEVVQQVVEVHLPDVLGVRGQGQILAGLLTGDAELEPRLVDATGVLLEFPLLPREELARRLAGTSRGLDPHLTVRGLRPRIHEAAAALLVVLGLAPPRLGVGDFTRINGGLVAGAVFVHRVVGHDAVGDEVVERTLNLDVVGHLVSRELDLLDADELCDGELVPRDAGLLHPLGLDGWASQPFDVVEFLPVDVAVAVAAEGGQVVLVAGKGLVRPHGHDVVAVQFVGPLVAQLARPAVLAVDMGRLGRGPSSDQGTIRGHPALPEVRGVPCPATLVGLDPFVGEFPRPEGVRLALVPRLL